MHAPFSSDCQSCIIEKLEIHEHSLMSVHHVWTFLEPTFLGGTRGSWERVGYSLVRNNGFISDVMTSRLDLLLRIDGDIFEELILVRLGVLPINPMLGEVKLLYMSIDCPQEN